MDKITFTTKIVDANDGTGDGMLIFPPGLIESMGWEDGTVLNLEIREGLLYLTENKLDN
jgi:hypothetical protein